MPSASFGGAPLEEPERGGPSAAPLVPDSGRVSLVVLGDVKVLLGVRVRDRVVGENVGCNRRVHRRREIRSRERHRGPLLQLLACELVALLAGELLVLL